MHKNTTKKNEKFKIGDIRPSQILWTYGPGALIDLPNLSVVTMGLDYWNPAVCTAIQEPRLLAAVQKKLGPQVERLLMPPVQQDEDENPFSPSALTGIPVKPFPRWLRCVKCGRLAEYGSDVFALKTNPVRPEKSHFVHVGCQKAQKHADAVPARFLVACDHGHLDDFPWHWFVHGGQSDCRKLLFFFEGGASLQTDNLWVKCECGARQNLSKAFGPDADKYLPGCRGRHPHLDRFEECHEPPRTIILGSTNGWFSVTLSVLALPIKEDGLTQFVSQNWDDLNDIESVEELKKIIGKLQKKGYMKEASEWDFETIFKAIQKKRAQAEKPADDDDDEEDEDLKWPEWNVFIKPNPPTDWPHFLSNMAPVPSRFAREITSVLLIERLRKVNALIGFTRIESPDGFTPEVGASNSAPLSLKKPEWVPACEVHGEGIFIRFNEEALQRWEKLSAVIKRDQAMQEGYKGWRNARRLDPTKGYPGARFVLLHTLSHLLLRQFSLECGYNGSSLQERIYADSEKGMAGILLYTATPDADGTLGGLVDLGKTENLERILSHALEYAKVCSSDPLCSAHSPEESNSTHAAACHSCAFVSETSCECGNKFLDRALVVPTYECTNAAFFPEA